MSDRAFILNSGASTKDVLERIEAGIQRDHGNGDRSDGSGRLVGASVQVVGVASLQPRVGDIQPVSEVVGDLAHSSPSDGDPGVPAPVVGESTVGAVSGAVSSGTPDTNPGGTR